MAEATRSQLAVYLHLQYACSMTVIERHTGMPPRAWRLDAQSVYRAHERAYRRAGTGALATVAATFQISPREVGKIFGISRQAIGQWYRGGVPPARLAEVSRVADVALRLRRTFKRERVPELVRRPNPGLAGESVLKTLAEPDGVARVMHALDRLTSYVPIPSALQ
jgi:hypothetical protein